MKRIFLTALISLSLLACGGRPDIWENPPSTSKPLVVGLANGVAVIDDAAHRAVLLLPLAGQELDRVALPIGKNVIRADDVGAAHD